MQYFKRIADDLLDQLGKVEQTPFVLGAKAGIQLLFNTVVTEALNDKDTEVVEKSQGDSTAHAGGSSFVPTGSPATAE